MSDPDALWARVYAAFEGHKQPPIDPTPQATLDRIAAKCIHVSFNRSNCTVREESLSLDDLRQLKRYDENDDRPNWEGGSIVVLVYKGQRVVIDGRRRVNKWLNEGSTERRSALIIEPQGVGARLWAYALQVAKGWRERAK